MGRPTPIVVTGMHRSGTSVVAKALECMGYSLGKTDIGKSPANPKGYQENVYMSTASSSVMKACGADWDQPIMLRKGFENAEVMDEIWERAKPFIEEEFPGDTRIVWKDPRVCLTLPFWAKYLGEEPICIVCVRSPVEVAKSLWERERMSPGLATTLWKTHMASIVRNANKRIFVQYDEVLNNPKKVWEDIFEFLYENTCEHEFDGSGLDDWKAYIDKGLHRSKSTPKELFCGKYDFGAVMLYLRLVDATLMDIVNAVTPVA